jgi:hypothetical protein
MRSVLTRAATAATALTAGALALAAPATAATPSPSACDRAPWEAKVQGTPSVAAGSRSGDYLFHNSTGFHLRVTHANHDMRVYSGLVSSTAPMHIDPVRLERSDTVRLSADHRTMLFVFVNHGYIDGVNFHTDCAARLVVSHLHVGNRDLPASQVYLGATKAHPARVPFAVHRL